MTRDQSSASGRLSPLPDQLPPHFDNAAALEHSSSQLHELFDSAVWTRTFEFVDKAARAPDVASNPSADEPLPVYAKEGEIPVMKLPPISDVDLWAEEGKQPLQRGTTILDLLSNPPDSMRDHEANQRE